MASVGARAADDDDELVIIDDVDLVDAPKGDAGVVGSDDDETIIILEEGAPPPTLTDAPSGPLGNVWDAWHVALDSELFAAAQLTDAETGPFRLLGAAWLETWLLPAPNLAFYGNALGRIAWDGTPDGHVTAFADVYELYARVTLDRATVNLGRLVVPWRRTQAAGLGDRLQPPDLRRGPPFPDPARQKQPQLGAQLKGSLDVVGLEGVAFLTHEPTEGALTAANQGGVRIGRYQTALARSPTLAGGLLKDDETGAARTLPILFQPTIAARVWRRVGEIDVNASVAWHFDETPTLTLSPELSHSIAVEGLALRGQAPAATPTPCEGLKTTTCLGPDALSYVQTTSMSVDASWGLGLVVVRAEAVAYPRLGALPGKTALILDSQGVSSRQVSQLSAAVAVEGQLGPAVDGSLELFDIAWDGVPGDARLWGVEILEHSTDDDPNELRTVHRLAAGANLGGAFFDDRVRWRLRGEAGVLQADMLLSAEVRYRLPVFDLYLGGRGDVFTGRPGSPGWMRQEASLLGIFLGEGA